ncbi:MAG: hypothetical protein SOW20_03935 [Berryella intestinalis]|nr:hypothetical protein [Berryella intestinalis]MDD7369982.1 hypothetical protein [Berryella intestinalis]MDY3129160.1 hypothetical protein [Berryella intestinalis]
MICPIGLASSGENCLPNATENPNAIHATELIPTETRVMAMVLPTFFFRESPPWKNASPGVMNRTSVAEKRMSTVNDVSIAILSLV